MDRLKMAPVAAASSAVIGFSAVVVALSMSPWFSWTENALSDLGHPRYPSAGVFGGGLAAAGLVYLGFVYALGAVAPRNAMGTAALLSLAGGALSLTAIGIVNESYGAPHLVVSITYFGLIPVGMLLLALSMKRSPPVFRQSTAVLSVVAGAIGITIIMAQEGTGPFSSQAIPEFVASVFLGSWSVVAAFWLASGRLAAPRESASTPQPRPSE